MAGKLHTITAPFKGLDLSETAEDEATLDVALNVDLSHGGTIRCRPAMTILNSGALTGQNRLHLTRNPSGPRYLLNFAGDGGGTAVYLLILGERGQMPSFTYLYDLTALFGEVPSRQPEGMFLETTLLYGGVTHHVTLLSTAYCTYVFDPGSPEQGPRRLSTLATGSGGDALREFEVNYPYWATIPHGGIVTEHQGRVVYAGFPPGSSAVLTRALPATQSAVPNVLVNPATRTEITLGPSNFVMSSEFDPAGVPIYYTFGLEEREPITGLKSFQENLVVFSDRSIYVLTGGTLDTMQLVKVVSGTGCIAPHSVVEARGLLYFMARDGVYRYPGHTDGVDKVSGPVDAMFSHAGDRTFQPLALGTKLSSLGWPFKVALGELSHAEGMFIPSRNQIWWSLPIEGRPARSFPITLVYDIGLKAWTTWAMTPASSTSRESCYQSGAVLQDSSGQETVITASCDGFIRRCGGGGYRDQRDGSTYNGPRLIAQTGRIFAASDLTVQFHPVVLKVLTTGKTPATNKPTAILTGETAHFQAAASEETAATVPTTPDDTQPFFWDSTTWGGATWMSADWWSCNVGLGVKSQSCRLTLVDDPDTDDRESRLVVQSIAINASEGLRVGKAGVLPPVASPPPGSGQPP